MLETHGVQTSVLYPAIHEFTAYRGHAQSLPRAEHAARAELTLPLYPTSARSARTWSWPRSRTRLADPAPELLDRGVR